MRRRDLVDGVVGPRTREMMDQMLCMKGMTNAEKVDFLMSRNRELRAENDKLRKLVRCLVNAEHPLDRAALIANAAYMLAELGFWEVES